MVSHLARRLIAAFERRWCYDASYMHELLDAGGIAAIAPLGALSIFMSYRRIIPISVYYTARLSASFVADCGPCAQLTMRRAEAAGIAESIVRAIVAGDRDALGSAERLGFDLARKSLAREDATAIRAEIVRRFGTLGLASLAYAIVAATAFPTFKYAFGYGHACVRPVEPA